MCQELPEKTSGKLDLQKEDKRLYKEHTVVSGQLENKFKS